jgi:transcriptional regulator with XRE-family HTH domain
MSQQDLAKKSGVARDTISKLESGRRKAYPVTIRKLAAGLELEPQMLLGGVEYLEETGGEEQSVEREDENRRIGF